MATMPSPAANPTLAIVLCFRNEQKILLTASDMHHLYVRFVSQLSIVGKETKMTYYDGNGEGQDYYL